MDDRVPAPSPRRQERRRSPRFRARVEALDGRQLLAAGVTGQVFDLDAFAGESLAFLNEDVVVAGRDGDFSLPLMALGNAANTLTAAGISATVDYGDGSGASPTEPRTEAAGRTSGTVVVLGPDHTYAAPGRYTITISVTEPGDATPTTFLDPVTVDPPFVSVTGAVADVIMTERSTGGGTSPHAALNYYGTTQPGATVVLTATNMAYPATNLVVGTTVADSRGGWNATTVPFVDGRYTIAAVATGQFGVTAAAFLAGPFDGFLDVDTAGPRVTRFQVTNPKMGDFAFTVDDAYGLNLLPLTEAKTYVVARSTPAPRRGQTFGAIDLASEPVLNMPASYAYVPVVVTGTLATNKSARLPNGTYTLTIPANAIFGLSGSPLDGEYAGQFPTGNGQGGGDFRIEIVVRNGKATVPIAAPAGTTGHPSRAKATPAARHHA